MKKVAFVSDLGFGKMLAGRLRLTTSMNFQMRLQI
jgi:hypothetical protein